MRPPICVRLGGQSELVEMGFDMKPLVLSLQGMMLPLRIVLWIVEFIDLLVEGIGKSCSEQVKCLDIIKIIPGMLSKMLKFGHIVVHIFSFHLEALLQGCLGAFLLQGVHEVSAEHMFHGCPQPNVIEGNSIDCDFINEPMMLGLYPLVDVWALEIGEEQ